MVVLNSWLLSRRAGRFDMPLLDTILAIADALCKTGQLARLNKLGRPSNANLQQMHENKRKRDQQKKSPKKIFEKMILIIYHISRRQIDQDLNLKSYIICTKCQIPSCLNKDRNCFLRFHTE
nr:unnamed protein product [Callosobruchus analis]